MSGEDGEEGEGKLTTVDQGRRTDRGRDKNAVNLMENFCNKGTRGQCPVSTSILMSAVVGLSMRLRPLFLILNLPRICIIIRYVIK